MLVALTAGHLALFAVSGSRLGSARRCSGPGAAGAGVLADGTGPAAAFALAGVARGLARARDDAAPEHAPLPRRPTEIPRNAWLAARPPEPDYQLKNRALET